MPEIIAAEAVEPSLLSGEPDDLAGPYLQRRQSTDAADTIGRWQRRLAGPQQPAAAPGTVTPAASPDGAPTAPAERTILGTAADVVLDIGEGLVELPLQVVGGVRDAAQEVLDGTADLARFLDLPGADVGEPIQLPEVPAGDTTTGAIVRKVSQFVTGFIPAMRATKGLRALGTAGPITQPLVAGALADVAVFDEHEDRLSNLIQEVPALQNPVTEYLAADPSDTAAEGRFKNALEGMALGGISDGFVATVRALRGVRRGKAALEDAPAAAPIEEPLARSDAPLFRVSPGARRKTPAELAVDDQGIATVPVAGRAANINLARLDTTDDVKRVITDMAAASADEIEVARRGTMSHDLTRQLADEIGMTPEQLVRRRPGQAFNAEEALASRRLLVASGENLTQLARKAASPNAGPVDLYNFRRAIAQHDAIQQEVAGLTAEAGRALSAFRIPAGASEQQLRAIRETIELMGGEGAQREMAKRISAFDDPAQLATFARQASRATTRDMLFEAWINGLLSGPTTHAVNVTSNAVVALWQIPERFLAAGIRRLTGGQGVELGEATAQTFGLVQGAKDGLRLAAKVLRTGEPEDVIGKVEVAQQRAITGANVGLEEGGVAARAVDFIGEVVRIPGRALMTEDTFFKSVGYRMELNARAWRQAVSEGLEGDALARRMQELIANPPRDLEMAATDAARYQTFTAPLGEGGRLLTAGANKVPGLRLIIPFIRTPANIVKFVGERTPLAPLARSVRADIAAGGARRDLALARIASGSLVMAVAAELSGQGLITGGGPVDPGMRAALRRTGWQPYSIRVGDTYYRYNRLDPLGMTLGIAADISEILGQVENADAETLAAAGVLAVSNNLISKTYLSGIADVVEIFTSASPELGASRAERFIQRFAGTAVPTAVATVERVVDPTLREVDSVVQQIRSRVPGYSDELPPRRNLWGEPIVLQGGLGPDIMSPIYTSEATDSPVDAEIVEHQVPIRMPSRVIEGVELTQQEYDALVRLAGNELKDPATGLGAKETLDAIVAGRHPLSDAYQRATDGPEGGKAKVIRETVNAFRAMARAQIQQDFPELRAALSAQRAEAARALTGEPAQ